MGGIETQRAKLAPSPMPDAHALPLYGLQLKGTIGTYPPMRLDFHIRSWAAVTRKECAMTRLSMLLAAVLLMVVPEVANARVLKVNESNGPGSVEDIALQHFKKIVEERS